MTGVAPASDGVVGTTGKQTLTSLQVLRGFAAAAVVLYHTHLILAKPEYGSVQVFGYLAAKGWLGVNFFFVLSGFIIFYAHSRDLGAPARVPAYLWRRFSRVYPIYWLMLTAYILAAFVGIGHPDFRVTAADFLSSYLLMPLVAEPSLPLQVAWTLFFEIGFYALFVLAILHRSLGLVVALSWPGAILVNGLVLGGTAFNPLNMWNIYFVIGAVVFLLFRRVDARLGWPLLAAGIALLVVIGAAGRIDDRIALASAQPARLLLLAAPFALILLGATVMERGRAWRPPGVLMLLGDASYSVYLVHSPTISVLAQITHKLAPGVVPPALLFVLVALASVMAGVVVHLLLERPLLALLRHPPRWRRGAVAHDAVAAPVVAEARRRP